MVSDYLLRITGGDIESEAPTEQRAVIIVNSGINVEPRAVIFASRPRCPRSQSQFAVTMSAVSRVRGHVELRRNETLPKAGVYYTRSVLLSERDPSQATASKPGFQSQLHGSATCRRS